MGVYKEFLEQIKINYSDESLKLIARALRQAGSLSIGLLRYDKTPFLHHAVGVARVVANDLGLGSHSVSAALLHDVARLGLISQEDIIAQYGDGVWRILQGMNSISSVDAKISTLQADNFRELIISYSTDPRVLLIKIADRLEVMRSLAQFPELKRNKKSWETLHLYAPLAHKLGLYTIKTELDDLSLKYLEPKAYNEIKNKLQESEQERVAYIKQFVAPIDEKLQSLGFHYYIKSRTKSIYSIWKKMCKQRVPFEKVFDLFAIRIILSCDEPLEKMQCWTAYSVVTDFYTPNPDRMRDWISIPKSNGYESLHATVLDSKHGDARWVEVQIRTKRMDEVAERGVAAHWRYKEQNAGSVNSEQWLERLRSIVDNSQSDVPATEEFDFTIGSSEVFVFTPNGDLRKLPEGASILDFAFDIHSNLGSTCTGAVVNGKAVSIKEKLRGGDIVTIKNSKNQKPRVDWLNFVVTNKAKNKIRQILREELASSATLGREELERKIKNWRLQITLEESVTLLCKHYKVRTGLEVYDMIAEGRASMTEIKDIISRYIKEGTPIQEPKPRKIPKEKEQKGNKNSDTLVIDDSVKGIDYKMAQCCSPIFGDDIFGFVTIHSGITIHRSNCPNAARLRENYPYRVIEARWRDEASSSGLFLVTIKVDGSDSQGVYADVSDALSRKLGLNVRSINLNAFGGAFRGDVVVEVPNTQTVDMILYQLRNVKGIDKATRVK